ncbi:MAG TPA: glycoside hydrolase family 2 TIM barrel-domain containing protein [Caldilineaceae bacterium]|nr:glycoside hydrolase family 2 TIM barrel-domain containing protein [Caldilineaceae bacterium]
MERRISLNGTWHYEPLAWTTVQADGSLVESTDNLPPGGEMELPMNWQLRGLDSFDGRVRFTRSFPRPDTAPHERVFLVFRGVDYFADVTLNGQFLGRHTGYFQPFAFEVTDQLRAGDNDLQVDVDCPKEEPGSVWPDHKWLIKGILSHWDCRPGSWDLATGQEKNSGGIWGDVYLEVRPHTFVTHVRASSKLTPREASSSLFTADEEARGVQALVRVELDVDSAAGGEFTLRLSLDDGAVMLPIHVPKGVSHHVAVVAAPEPKLWWPWDLGEPYLYTLRAELHEGGQVLSRFETEFGIRELTLNPHTGEWTVNGVRFFVRGTNVIPTLWLGEYDAAMIGRDIEMLKAAHINGVRVCVHINRDEFYTACDRAGIIVWQDFALQWGYTPDPRFTHEAARQVQEMVHFLYNHACIALWCTQNESSYHNRVVLNPVLAQAAAQADSSRYVRATSEFSEHAYPGWYSGHVRDYLTLPGAPILTEFGAQALPSVEEVRRMRGGDTWPPGWDGLAYHDFQYDQTFHVAGIEMGGSLEEFVENSQRYQADLLKFAVEHYRRHKYTHIGGMFQFMFMDCWPSITWSVVSYHRVPKQGYFTLQQVYQPVLIGTTLGREKVLIGADRGGHPRPLRIGCWVVNDRHETLDGCTYVVTLEQEGHEVAKVEGRAPTIAADSVVTLPRVELALADDLTVGAYTVRLALRRGEDTLSCNQYPLALVKVPAS